MAVAKKKRKSKNVGNTKDRSEGLLAARTDAAATDSRQHSGSASPQLANYYLELADIVLSRKKGGR